MENLQWHAQMRLKGRAEVEVDEAKQKLREYCVAVACAVWMFATGKLLCAEFTFHVMEMS